MAARMRATIRRVLFVTAFLACSAAARAANNCPWLNEATASSILEGAATGEYVPATADKLATCTFTQTGADRVRQLIIVVEIAARPHDRMLALAHDCEKPEPMPSIGNEVVRCPARMRGGAHGERIIGRVRDQVFSITITTTAKQDSVLSEHELSMRSTSAAEQVSGNLF